MKLFEDFLEASAKLADQAVKVAGEAFEQSKAFAGEAMDKGKKKVNQLALESDLAKAERQLGALMYVMHKTGEHNPELLEQYLADVEKIDKELERLKAEDSVCSEQYITPDEVVQSDVKVCPACGEEVTEGDIYCRSCGEKLN